MPWQWLEWDRHVCNSEQVFKRDILLPSKNARDKGRSYRWCRMELFQYLTAHNIINSSFHFKHLYAMNSNSVYFGSAMGWFIRRLQTSWMIFNIVGFGCGFFINILKEIPIEQVFICLDMVSSNIAIQTHKCVLFFFSFILVIL